MTKITPKPEPRIYTRDELITFNNTLNKFYDLRTIVVPETKEVIEAEILDIKSLREAFLNSKPEQDKDERTEVFEWLLTQWRNWKFATHYERSKATGFTPPYKD